MNFEVFISCAVTGSGDTVGKHPSIPVTPKQIAGAALEAARAGAAIAHCHVRDPETGAGSRDPALYREVVERIRESDTDVIINLTSGMGGDLAIGHGESPTEFGNESDLVGLMTRLVHVEELLPDICSLDCGTLNFGDGFELALSCDLIVAAEHAEFCLPEIKIGVLADAATFRLPRRMPRNIAMELLMTGRRMGAEEAARWGLVNAVAPSAMDRAREFAALLASGPPLALAAVKAVVRETEMLGNEECYAFMRSGQLAAFEAMLTSEDAREGPRAFAEKRDPVWQGR